ncbi:MAG: hypothetical protein VX112_02490 [Pseudomonadota bacterium]|nr:hypothetical protein [Pseudomonadota bacterium]
MIAFRVVYERHYLRRKVIVYAKDERDVLMLFPRDTDFISIRRLNVVLDRIIRFLQYIVVTERVMQQRLINLLELFQSCLKKENLVLNRLLQETLLADKPRYFQHELCHLFFYLEGGHSLGDALVDVMRIPSYISGVMKVATKGDHVQSVLQNTISHFNFLVSRNFRVSKLIYIQIFLTLTEAIAAHYAAKTKFNEYFFSIQFRGDTPPAVAQVYVDIFVALDVQTLLVSLAAITAAIYGVKIAYYTSKSFRFMIDWLRLRVPLVKQVEYIGTQLHIFRALKMSDSIHISHSDSIRIVSEQIENSALQVRWQQIVAEQEKYGLNTLAMVDALLAPSSTLVRPEPETMMVTETDIELLQMDIVQRYYRQDMFLLGFGFLIIIGIPLWGVIAFALTQNYFWLKTLTLSI